MFHFGVVNIYAKYICIYNLYIYSHESWVMSHIITHLYLTSFDYYRICDLQNYFPPRWVDALVWHPGCGAPEGKPATSAALPCEHRLPGRPNSHDMNNVEPTGGKGGRWWHINLPLSHSSEASSSEVYAQSQLGSLPCDKIQVNHEKTSIFHRFIRLDGGLTKQYYT